MHTVLLLILPREYSEVKAAIEATTLSPSHCASSTSKDCELKVAHASVPAPSPQASRTSLMNAAWCSQAVPDATDR